MWKGNVFTSICHSVHMGGGICGKGGMCGKGGVHGEGTCVAKGGACVAKRGMRGKGRACVAKRGMCGKGRACVAQGRHVWQRGGMCGKGWACMVGACVAGETATAADGTHPTGMHSLRLRKKALLPKPPYLHPMTSLVVPHTFHRKLQFTHHKTSF